MSFSASPPAEADDGSSRLALAASSALEAETVGDQATVGEAWRRYRLIKDAQRNPDELLVEGIALSEAAIDLAAVSRNRL